MENHQAEKSMKKKEARENAAHGITNLYTSDGFEALVELSQYINPVTDKIAAYEEEEHKIFFLENRIKSPYFYRINFKFDKKEEFKKIYIGRSYLRKTIIRECMFMIGDHQLPVFFIRGCRKIIKLND